MKYWVSQSPLFPFANWFLSEEIWCYHSVIGVLRMSPFASIRFNITRWTVWWCKGYSPLWLQFYFSQPAVFQTTLRHTCSEVVFCCWVGGCRFETLGQRYVVVLKPYLVEISRQFECHRYNSCRLAIDEVGFCACWWLLVGFSPFAVHCARGWPFAKPKMQNCTSLIDVGSGG